VKKHDNGPVLESSGWNMTKLNFLLIEESNFMEGGFYPDITDQK
jgi:hypothetical protein